MPSTTTSPSPAAAPVQAQVPSSSAASRARFLDLTLDLMGSWRASTGRWSRVNRAFARALGWREDEWLHRPFTDFIHPEDRVAARAAFERAMLDGAPAIVDHRLVGTDGRVRRVSWSLVADRAEGVLVCCGRDVTDRAAADEAGAASLRLLATLTGRLRHARSEHDAVAVATRLLGEHFHALRVGYAEVDADGVHVGVDDGWLGRGVASVAGRHRLADFGGEDAARALAEGRTCFVEDLARQLVQGTSPAEVLAGVRAHLVAPVMRQGRLAALLFVHVEAPRRWSEADRALAGEVAERTWWVIEESRDSHTLREGERRTALLLHLLQSQRESGDPRRIAEAAARAVGERLAADRVSVVRVSTLGVDGDPDGVPELEPLASWTRGVLLGPIAMRLPASVLGARVVGALRDGHTLGVPDLGADLVTADARLRRLRTRALVGAPIVRAGRWVAAMLVEQAVPRAWSPGEIALVREVADQTWDGLQRAEAEAALRVADRRKDEFLATLAHELRNPLAPLRNGLQIARLTNRGDATLQRTVEMMDRQLSHLVRLVDDLLDVGRISSGKLALRRRPLRLADVLDNAIESVRVIIEAHRHELVVQTQPEAEDVRVLGDFDRLVQVFMNLLSNAVKYTEPGGRLLLRVRREDGQAVVSVADSGIGIPAEDLGRVFELFSQVRSHQGRAEGGLGIGLSLVRSLVALHGGAVEVQSEGTGHGSVFTVRLPELPPRPDDAAGRRASDRAESRTEERPREVLVVDDNVDAAASLAALLQLRGHHVRVAHDGLEALDRAAEAMPEILFLDLGMPRLGGIDAAKRLRGLPGGDGVLLVALTGWGQDADLQRTHEAGFDRHVVKPVDAATLDEIMVRGKRVRK